MNIKLVLRFFLNYSTVEYSIKQLSQLHFILLMHSKTTNYVAILPKKLNNVHIKTFIRLSKKRSVFIVIVNLKLIHIIGLSKSILPV